MTPQEQLDFFLSNNPEVKCFTFIPGTKDFSILKEIILHGFEVFDVSDGYWYPYFELFPRRGKTYKLYFRGYILDSHGNGDGNEKPGHNLSRPSSYQDCEGAGVSLGKVMDEVPPSWLHSEEVNPWNILPEETTVMGLYP